MIFAHTLASVLAGEKTQTRRLVKAGETLSADGRCIRTASGRNLYRVGKSYAVQPKRGKRAVARIRITSIKRERVNAISTEDARAEGFQSRSAFLAAWRSIHGAHADLSAEVWVISFHLEYLITEEVKTYAIYCSSTS